MVFCNSSTHLPCQKALYLFRSSITIIILSFFLPSSYSLYFNFPRFGPNTPNITNYGDAFLSNRAIELTENRRDVPVNGSTGRAIYSKPVHLWDSQTGRLTDFTTHFSFIMNSFNRSTSGDGLAFFLAANGSYIPPASAGGQIGLFSSDSSLNSMQNQLVAVEFDSYMNEWDPSADHIGINVNSIVSKANVTWRSSIKNGSRANAWVSYNSSTKNLSVFLTYAQNQDFGGNSSLYYLVDLREMLPDWINIGFSAATRTLSETHQILSWNFTSTLEEVTVGSEQPKKENNKRSTGLVVRMVVGGAVLIIGLSSLLWFGLRRSVRFTEDLDELPNAPKFTHNQLVLATNNFSEDGKLGEGSSPIPGPPSKMLKDMNFTPQLSDTIDATSSSSTDSSNSSATDSLHSGQTDI
ncbi:hypothetical protein MRB53_005713 [Persea americana]|uniref:Uncharacterized protein n=1 Tax=Persea americana TaxID=3435 RepID=A0ACC2ME68_PERAE|nr:hypothetical protein MRB53_005713 [Persea americana]